MKWKGSRSNFLVLVVSIVTCFFGASRALAQSDVPSRPNVFSIEVLGRGGEYSLDYDTSVSENVSLGIGLEFLSASSGSVSATALVLPLYGNFYFSPGPHRGFLTAGLDIVTATINFSGAGFSGTGAIPVIGGGYEYRGSSGFVFRFPLYLFITSDTQLRFGLGFGFSF